MWIKIKRIIKSGFFSFWRNGFVSLSSILVMVVTLFVIGTLIFSSAILKYTLDQVKNKVDINVYLVPGAQEPDILTLKKDLEALPEVATVTYVTADEALADFKTKHQNDQFTLQALSELGNNPLGATLNVKAKDPSQYASIANFLQTSSAVTPNGTSIVDKVNYYQNQDAINSLTRLIDSANRLGFILTIVLVVLSVLITFNTLRLVIYMSRDEISVMRLVGASRGYIRGPFFVAGAIYGFISALITLILFYPITIWLGNTTQDFFVGMNIFQYYTNNFGEIFLIIVASGVIIGAISSWLAVHKYLKV
jgi:cell division transport system permease protein